MLPMDDHNFRFSITLISAFWQLKHKHHICKYYILANITVLSQKQINSPIVALLSLNSFNNSMNNNPNTLWIPITTNWLKKDAGTTSQLKPLSIVVLEQTSRFILYGGFGLRRYSDYNLGRRLFVKIEPPAKCKWNRRFHARIPSAYTVSTIRCSIT